jgi:hypothetical protein
MGFQNEWGTTALFEDLWQNQHDWFTHPLLILKVLAFCQKPWHIISNCCCLQYVPWMYRGQEQSNGLSYFCDRLSTQGLAYLPVCGQYPGDRAMQVFTKLSLKDHQRMFQDKETPRRKAGRPSNATIRSATRNSIVTPKQFKTGKHNQIKSRHCGDFGCLLEHLASFAKPATKVKYGKKCEGCG